jgi:hypothetical protein
MGTRSLTAILDEQGNEICVMYRQYDGYPSGHGLELAEFLKPFTIVNGYGMDDKAGQVANGMNDLAAQLVAHFKDGVGNIYLHAAGTRDAWEEYLYTVSWMEDPIRGVEYVIPRLKCEDIYHKKVLFDGPAAAFTGAEQAASVVDDECIYCQKEFNHPNHARNHYAVRHSVAV